MTSIDCPSEAILLLLQKASALGKPDVDLFIALTDRHDLPTTSQSDSTQLKAGNFQSM